MEQNMKPIVKQLAIAAFILTSVTVLSFGIRQVRFSVHRAETGDFTPSARPEDQLQPEQTLGADPEPDHYPADSYTVDAEPDPQYANALDWDEETPPDDYSEAHTDPGKHGKAVSMTKSFKGDYAKPEGSKGLQKISLGDYEDLYRTGEGELWYVSKRPDGKAVKMQVQVDNITGEITAVSGGDYAKSEGTQGLQRIPMGDNDNIYITGEGELWYTSEQPDGSGTKVQLEEDINGEIDIVDSGEDK